MFVSQNLTEFYASHPLEGILVCVYTICLEGQILISCIISSGSPFLPSCV